VVGLDIGSSAVKAVQLKQSGKAYRVAAFASEPVPADAIVDGAIIDADAVVASIRRLFDNGKAFKTSDVCASLSGNTVIVKKITLPVMTETELHDSIYWEAEQYIPFDIQDVNLDYQVLDPGTGPEARGSMEVLLVAAKKEKIGRLHQRHHPRGPQPRGGRRGRIRAAERLRGQLRLRARARRALLNAGASSININIVQGDQSVFTRDISVGGNAYTEAVQKELGTVVRGRRAAEAGTARRRRDLRGRRARDARRHRERALEVQKTIEFFKATAGVDHIDQVVLSGGVSRLEGLQDLLAERLHAPVEAVRPVPRREVGRRETGRSRSGDGGIDRRGGRGPRTAAGR
jgi:type IV pilus assembly protein PilM